MDIFKKTTELDKEVVLEVISKGDIAVDATSGNGHDTLFLARQVGSKGLVYAFDIQKKAIDRTKTLLENNGVENRVNLIKEDHSNLAEIVPSGVAAIMFNLGYLPGSDKSVVTLPETTLSALHNGLKLLKVGGILTCVIYPGHDMGKEESNEVENFAKELNYSIYQVVKIISTNRKQAPPYLLAIKKRKEVSI
ncbi:class I SAM-dependent methyltransferase [Natranaerofaba carboxydovora]|uniref:class I SAM-dependent methyltransferase n=1 Tax=Natranaerofaba carboxydovora TaxID=2742683 RepID=UPI001F137912|nr:class I SAM-dependent methyltransferase [Natranaerofaba carboxydovora]UMZ75359.1 Putative rRNA methylase [Natranaerofaba carboxydovora]